MGANKKNRAGSNTEVDGRLPNNRSIALDSDKHRSKIDDSCVLATSLSCASVSFLKGLASDLYRQRRMRDRIFEKSNLFGEPAWDILLDLYVAHLDKRSVSVSSACIASCVPATTALRCIGRLESLELLRRLPDRKDNRRVLITLTCRAIAMIELYLREWLPTSVAKY